MTILIRIALSVSLLALAACSQGAAPSGAGGDSADAGGGTSAVDIADLRFSPAAVEVAAGGTVSWTNRDTAPHTVTFEDDGVQSSDELGEGDTFSATFPQPGSYSYICAIHPDMTGTVTVA